MVEIIPPPDVHSLLPPLLACLPTAFASTRPPPALLPLLSPILRQRLQLQTFDSTSTRDNWLRLLSWDNAKGELLKEEVENVTFEPHPVSGEIEIGDTTGIRYKRYDEETLKAQVTLSDWPFTPIYLWCTGGEQGNLWLLAELLPSDGEIISDPTWLFSIREADEHSKERIMAEALKDADASSSQRKTLAPVAQEDDYWAMYDNTPGRTPIRKSSANPEPNHASDADYYSRYQEVQPAMDNHDPEEESEDIGHSTLNGHALQQMINAHPEQQREPSPPPYQDSVAEGVDEKEVDISQPIPSSPSSRGGSDNVARLERTAERYAASEIGITQHISTTVKSMFRLARSAGMDREEFERLIQRELETLSIFEKDD